VYSGPASRRQSVVDAAPRRASFVSGETASLPTSTVDTNGAPLQKTKSGSNEGTKVLGKVEEVEEGKAIWFSTREETLSKLELPFRARQTYRSLLQRQTLRPTRCRFTDDHSCLV